MIFGPFDSLDLFRIFDLIFVSVHEPDYLCFLKNLFLF